MDERGLTIEQIAAMMVVSERTVRRWLAGTPPPGRNNAIRLGQVFEIDWREFYEVAA